VPTPTITLTPSPTPPTECPGDCDGNGAVGINELIVGVNIALNTLAASACRPFDINGNTAVEIDELITCVNAALRGCSATSAAGRALRGQNETAGADRQAEFRTPVQGDSAP
jgi:hypothetical protein